MDDRAGIKIQPCPGVKFFHLQRRSKAEVHRVVEFVREYFPSTGRSTDKVRPGWGDFPYHFFGQTEFARSRTLVFPIPLLIMGNSYGTGCLPTNPVLPSVLRCLPVSI